MKIEIGKVVDKIMSDEEKAYEEFAVKHNYNYIPGIPYPWDCMSHMSLGLGAGLHVVASRPSVGKTSFLIQCCLYWCEKGYRVVYNSIDMTKEMIIKKLISNLSNVSIRRMEYGWATPEELYKTKNAIEKLLGWFNEGKLEIISETKAEHLSKWICEKRKIRDVDILIVDSLQNIRMSEYHSPTENSDYAASILKDTAIEHDLPIIISAQVNRNHITDPKGKRPPELSDLCGSGLVEELATTVVLLHKVAEVIAAWKSDPPLYYLKQTNDPRLNDERAKAVAAVSWNLAKNQNGPTGELPFVVFQQAFRWYIGNDEESKAEKYHRIMADWRFLEEPFKTAEKNGAVVYPMFWPQKCAEVCGKLGLEIPSHIRDQLSKWDIERYNALLKEHSKINS